LSISNVSSIKQLAKRRYVRPPDHTDNPVPDPVSCLHWPCATPRHLPPPSPAVETPRTLLVLLRSRTPSRTDQPLPSGGSQPPDASSFVIVRTVRARRASPLPQSRVARQPGRARRAPAAADMTAHGKPAMSGRVRSWPWYISARRGKSTGSSACLPASEIYRLSSSSNSYGLYLE
jgi:hypothetical protein